jgi:hypothetical protein
MITESKSQLSPGVQERRAKAEALVASGKVRPVYGRPGEFVVEGTGRVYVVGASCVCPDSINRHDIKGQCKHKLAATIFAQQRQVVNNPQTPQASTSERSLEELIAELY